VASEFLPIIRENSILTLQELLPQLLPGPSERDVSLFFCQAYRHAGIAHFLMYGDPLELFSSLSRSGRAYAHFLSLAPDTQKLTSRVAPFFDAVVAGDDAVAADIATLSRPTWNSDEEYEDDFLYALFLLRRFYLSASQAELTGLLQRYEQVLDGAPDPRLDVCLALLADDSGALDAALLDLAGAVAKFIQERIRAGVVIDSFAETEPYIWVEGLALIRLARTRGLELSSDYPMAPSLAMIAGPASYAADDWQKPGE
jgi:hypothetical protein